MCEFGFSIDKLDLWHIAESYITRQAKTIQYFFNNLPSRKENFSWKEVFSWQLGLHQSWKKSSSVWSENNLRLRSLTKHLKLWWNVHFWRSRNENSNLSKRVQWIRLSRILTLFFLLMPSDTKWQEFVTIVTSSCC